MIKSNTILFFLLLTIVFGCIRSNDNKNELTFSEKDLPGAINLRGKKYSFEEITNPRGVVLKDNLALIIELKNNDDKKFHIIDLDSEKHLRTKGKDGLGPGEVTMIYAIYDVGIPNKVWAYDIEQRTFYKYDLLDSVITAENQVRAPQTTHFVTEAAFTSETTLLANLVDGWTKYIHLNIQGDTLSTFGDWQEMITGKELPNGYKANEIDANAVSSLFQGKLKANKEGDKAIKVGLSVPFIEIIDIKESKTKVITGPLQELPNFSISYYGGYQMVSFDKNSPSYYTDVFVGKDSFFVLYSGKPFSQQSEETNLNRVFEFDFEGRPLHQYQLDYPLRGFTVDETKRLLYGVTSDREPNLVRYELGAK